MSARRKKLAAASDPHPITYLPFVKDTKRGRNFWTIAGRTGDYGLDSLLGTEMARLAIDYMKLNTAPMLGAIVRDMFAAGTIDGVEIGFLQEFAKAAIRKGT